MPGETAGGDGRVDASSTGKCRWETARAKHIIAKKGKRGFRKSSVNQLRRDVPAVDSRSKPWGRGGWH